MPMILCSYNLFFFSYKNIFLVVNFIKYIKYQQCHFNIGQARIQVLQQTETNQKPPGELPDGNPELVDIDEGMFNFINSLRSQTFRTVSDLSIARYVAA